MAVLKQFRLPDVGEGLAEAEILRWCVGVGDPVATNQTIVEVETAKAAVELPCPFDGVVAEIHVPEGQTVDVGTPIITVAVDAPDSPDAAPPAAPATTSTTSTTPPTANAGPGAGREAVLVGYGVRPGNVARRPRRAEPSRPGPSAPPSPRPVSAPANGVAPAPARGPALAKPPVRKLARDLGVDLRRVTPTRPDGVITHDDVRTAAGHTGVTWPPEAAALPARAPDAAASPGGLAERRIPVRGVRKATAEAMVRSAFTAPHAGVSVTVDVSATLRLVKKLRALPEFDGVRVTVLLLIARAVLLAVRRRPEVNSTWDAEAAEIVQKGQVNLGIAAATPRGLVVPNVKAADTLTLADLGRAVDALVRTAREGRSTPADLTGGTLTITNVGVFGVDAGMPILNPGEAMIVSVGAITERPWVVRDRSGRSVLAPRPVVTLGAVFDHRIVDGEAGSKFLADIAAVLHDPELALAWT